jgi:hypothetical protein
MAKQQARPPPFLPPCNNLRIVPESVRGKLGLPVESDRHFEADKTISAYTDEARTHDISSLKCCTTYTAAIHNSSAVHSGRGIGATRNPNSQRRHRLLLLRLLLPILPSHRPPELIQSACTPRRGLPLEKSPRTLEVRDLLQPQSDYHLPRTTSERRQLASSVRIGAALKVTKPRRNRKTLFYGRLPGCTCLGSASLLTSAPCPACGPP